MATKIAVICGSARKACRTLIVTRIAMEGAIQAGAEARLLDLAELDLPVMKPDDASQAAIPAVQLVREMARWADGFLLGTPEYHGNLSGALKNWFDYLYPELAGKLAGVVAVTGGGSGDMSIVATKNSFAWCHGFTLPFHAAARGSDFEGAVLVDEKVRDRVQRVGHDVVRYAPVLRAAFESAKAEGRSVPAGFAGLHAR